VILDVLSQVDYFAVVFAAVAGLAVGTVWYLPAVFGRQWQASLARSEQRRQGPPVKIVRARGVATVIAALSLEVMLIGSGATTLGGALRLGGVVSLGLVATTIVSDYLYAGWSPRLIAITVGHRILHILVMCAVLGLI
jgi:hypothetical protein